MSYPHSISRALASVGRRKKLALVHLLANAVIGALAYGWLLIPEAAIWQIGASAVAAAGLVGAFLWLHGGTLNVFGESADADSAAWPAFAGTARRVPALFVWLMTLLAARWVLHLVDVQGWAFVIASWLTLNLKRPISPPDVAAWLMRGQTLLWWFVVALWLPLGREVARAGFSAFRGGWQSWRGTVTSAGYWRAVIVLWIAGVWLPSVLVDWVPLAESFLVQVISLVLRFLPAIVLALTAWLTLLALVAQAAAPQKDT
jgi:hypothetical protein